MKLLLVVRIDSSQLRPSCETMLYPRSRSSLGKVVVVTVLPMLVETVEVFFFVLLA